MQQWLRARSRIRLVRARGLRPGDADRGSAVAEFVMVAGLLLFVAMAVFQIGLTLYVRNALISAASEGARYGARADASVTTGVDRTRSLISAGLSDDYARSVSARETSVDGVAVVEITVTAPLPVMGLLGPAGTMTVSGRAFNERQLAAGTP